MIRKRGDKFVLLSKDGNKVLGAHNTMEAAKRQERAIKASENKKK
jgi:hypothetical protein